VRSAEEKKNEVGRRGERTEQKYPFTPPGLTRQTVLSIGAGCHRAMVATAPGEKLLIGRRPMRN